MPSDHFGSLRSNCSSASVCSTESALSWQVWQPLRRSTLRASPFAGGAAIAIASDSPTIIGSVPSERSRVDASAGVLQLPRMTTLRLTLFLLSLGILAQAPWDIAKKAAGNAATKKLESEINTRLLEEGRKNQCNFKTDSDQFEKSCDKKLRNVATALIDAKKRLNTAGVQNFKFEVSGHTDSAGNEPHNVDLSKKRAAVIVKELIAKGIPEKEIESVGKGSSERLVKPDDTPAKRAKNRRYEVRVRL